MNYKRDNLKIFRWALSFVALWMIAILLIGCGATDSSVDSQEFYDDFGGRSIFFNYDGCNTWITVTEDSNNYVINDRNNRPTTLGRVDREVIKDVGIRYSAHEFTLTKYFDGRVVYTYFEDTCTIYNYPNITTP